MPALKRPSFLPSLEDLEQDALRRSEQRSRPGSQFDHPTAKNIFVAGLVLTVAAHVIGAIVFAIIGF
ncbi:hypothetical protein [Actinomadura parmotrematis]|uniref:Uncharacterized protein n=1 Tax=Actinomadura parmotrematis TaxID=2864039 RepID=A0ABS7FSV2_9ACTN|nr:hypothetical protein [Actinomadura parmotrematis]MBW8482603.1 hypothetical protein [Actinomadura parmotrematis]